MKLKVGQIVKGIYLNTEDYTPIMYNGKVISINGCHATLELFPNKEMWRVDYKEGYWRADCEVGRLGIQIE